MHSLNPLNPRLLTCLLVFTLTAPARSQEAKPPGESRVDFLGDPLPAQALARLGSARLQVHGPAVFVPGRNLLIAADREIHFLDFSGRELKTLPAGPASYQNLTLSTDGKLLAAFGFDHTVRVLDTVTGKDLATLTYTHLVEQAAFVEDGRLLLTAEGSLDTRDGALLRLREAVSGKEIWKLAGKAFTLSPDRTKFASLGVPNPNLRFHEVKTGRELESFAITGHEPVWSPDGKRVALAGWSDHAVRVWDVAERKLERQFDGGRGPLSFSPDGKAVAFWDYADRRDQVLLADVATGKTLASFGSNGFRVEFSPDGSQAIAPSRKHSYRLALWDTRTWQERFPLASLTNFGSALVRPTGEPSFSSDGKTLVTVDPTRIRLWETATGTELATPPGHPDGTRWAFLDPTGRSVLSAGRDGTLLQRDLADGSELHRLKGNGIPAALSADQKRVAWLENGSLVVRDRKTHQELRRWQDRTRNLSDQFHHETVAFAPDGKTLAWGTLDNPILLLDLASGKVLQRLVGHETRRGNRYVAPSGILTLRFAPDGRTLFSIGADTETRVWDVATGQGEVVRNGLTLRHAWQPSDQPVYFSVGWRLQMQKKDRREGGTGLPPQESWILADPVNDRGRALPAEHTVMSPDNRTLAQVAWTTDEICAIILHDLPSGQERGRLRGHRRPITALSFSADGQRLVSASVDGTVLIWDMAKQ